VQFSRIQLSIIFISTHASAPIPGMRSNGFERYRKDKICRPTDFKEAIRTAKPGQNDARSTHGKALSEFGYSQVELASFLNLHYLTISRILAIETGTAKVKT
jgi:hypothetical protein